MPGLISKARTQALGPSETEEFRLNLPIGLGAVLAALASLATCYSGILAASIFGVEWFAINSHVQAILMWSLALLAVVFLWRDRRRHLSNLPLAIGGFASATLIFTLYFDYDTGVEVLAYTLLVIAALLNQNVLLNSLNQTVLTQASEIEELNRQLSQQVKLQGREIDRLGRLKQFLAPPVAELVVAEGDNALLETHRRYIACVFCDIRNFTALSEAVEPEDVITVLQDFHDRIGSLVEKYRGTIGYRAGDGLMVFFNDPVPCEQPVLVAVDLALEIQAEFEDIRVPWQKLGHTVGLGVGIASGYATLGLVGFKGRSEYTAIGGVVNIASRLCNAAEDKEILISRRAYLDVDDRIQAVSVGGVELKGFHKPVEALRIAGDMIDTEREN